MSDEQIQKVIDKNVEANFVWEGRAIKLRGIAALAITAITNVVVIMGIAAVGLLAVWGISFFMKMIFKTWGVL